MKAIEGQVYYTLKNGEIPLIRITNWTIYGTAKFRYEDNGKTVVVTLADDEVESGWI
jgi:hypothetical protein